VTAGNIFDLVSLGGAAIAFGVAAWVYRSEDARVRQAGQRRAAPPEAEEA
jgi:hypothetical protein